MRNLRLEEMRGSAHLATLCSVGRRRKPRRAVVAVNCVSFDENRMDGLLASHLLSLAFNRFLSVSVLNTCTASHSLGFELLGRSVRILAAVS